MLPSKPRRKPRRLIESSIQCGFLVWLEYQYPEVRRVTFSIPNGGARTPQYGARLKAEGLMAGVPDLFIAYPVTFKHGLFLEFKKSSKEKPTKPQQNMMELLIAREYTVRVVYGVDSAIGAVKDYLGVRHDRLQPVQGIGY